MSKICYKTMGNESPTGKQKVWFSCHPDDFDRYFPSISQEIFNIQDCVIYYDIQPNAPYNEEELKDVLMSMQLIVIPVTTGILTKKCRAIEFELKVAAEGHIPIIPIVQEDGLEDLYSRIMGNIQFINKTEKDITSIPYEQKLRKSVIAVLIKDELSKRIRDAFDAYVFLSYRKIDRKHIYKIMKRIHSNEFARDVAIWYDEYLTAGENYNDEIAEVLIKSAIFSLVVTPNLLEDGNYIIQKEYPLAREHKKSIIAMEVEKTDKNLFDDVFSDVDNYFSIDDITGFSDRIKNQLDKLQLRKNKSSEQDFLMGLAYLGGIDVEIDLDKALELIKSSASAGHVDAMKKLSNMYMCGHGVDANIEEGVNWLKIAAKKSRQLYNENPDIDNYIELMNLYIDYGYACMENALYDEAKTSLKKALRLGRQSNRYNLEYTEETTKCYVYIADVYMKEKKYNEARNSYVRALHEITKQFVNTEDNTEEQTEKGYDVSCVTQKLAYLEHVCGNYTEARGWYNKSITFLKACTMDRKITRIIHDLVLCYTNMGLMEQDDDKMETSRQLHLEALKICKDIPDDDEWKYNKIFEITLNIIKIDIKDGYFETAKERLLELEQDYKEFIKKKNEIQIDKNLSILYGELGDVYYHLGNDEEAKKYYYKALKKCESLPDNDKSNRMLLTVCYYNIGRIMEKEKNYEQSKKYYGELLNLCFSEASNDLGEQTQINLVTAYCKVADIEKIRNNYTEARKNYFQALKIANKLNKNGGNILSQKALSECYHKVGNIEKLLNNNKKALFYFNKLLELCQMFVQNHDSYENERSLALVFYDIGETHMQSKRYETAEDYLGKSLDTIMDLADKYGVNLMREEITMVLESLIGLYKAEGKSEKVYKYNVLLRNYNN